ncbi:MAG: biotin synthase, partial [Firmicutes bacterium]|nr:biotin synthase [Bacillota bacterium]
VSENIYRTFKAKRVYFSAYVPVSDSPLLPDPSTPVPLTREHRMYQADWLLRFYGFRADEILDEKNPYLDPLLDPKVTWALRNIERFPIEVNKAPLEDILRIPGIGTTTALRIVRQRRVSAVCYEDLRKMGVVLKRAKYFLTCSGKYYGNNPDLNPIRIRREILGIADEEQLSMFRTGTEIVPAGENPWKGIR